VDANVGVVPLTDPDQLRRLRVLYQFGTDQGDEQDLRCNYPIPESTPAAGTTQPVVGTVAYPSGDGKKDVTVTIGPPPKGKNNTPVYRISCLTGNLRVNPNPTFLNPPSCIVCATAPVDGVTWLDVNPRLKNHWLKSANSPLGIPPNAISLGYHNGLWLYVDSEEDLKHFY
jgi:hypothetical protein